MFASMLAGGWAQERRAANLLDGGAPFYDVYETSDGRHMSVGALEPQFYALLLEKLGLSAADLPPQNDRTTWPAMKQRFEAIFKTKTRDEWCRLMEGSDVCFAPVLSIAEAPRHPHAAARNAYVDVAGVTQPAPAPRFSRTPPSVQSPAPVRGAHTDQVLDEFGFEAAEIKELRAAAIIA
jgi:alpha-methylacyl-CoA racemase